MNHRTKCPPAGVGAEGTVFGESSKSNSITSTATDKFRAAMLEAGLACRGEIIPDGKLRRVHIEGDRRGSRNGWYVLYLDGVPAGAFGSWKTGETRTWCARETHRFTEAERAEYQRRINEAQRHRDEEQAHARLKGWMQSFVYLAALSAR